MAEHRRLFCGERICELGVNSQDEAFGIVLNSILREDSAFLKELQFELGLTLSEENSEELLVFSRRTVSLTED